jgi:hypothetical protein
MYFSRHYCFRSLHPLTLVVSLLRALFFTHTYPLAVLLICRDYVPPYQTLSLETFFTLFQNVAGWNDKFFSGTRSLKLTHKVCADKPDLTFKLQMIHPQLLSPLSTYPDIIQAMCMPSGTTDTVCLIQVRQILPYTMFGIIMWPYEG